MTDMSVSFPRQGAPWGKRLCLIHLHLLRSKHHVTNFSWTGRIQQSLKVIYLTPRWLVCELLIAWYHQGNRALVLQFCLLFFICKKGGITSKPWTCVWSAIEWPRHGAGWMKWVCRTRLPPPRGQGGRSRLGAKAPTEGRTADALCPALCPPASHFKPTWAGNRPTSR